MKRKRIANKKLRKKLEQRLLGPILILIILFIIIILITPLSQKTKQVKEATLSIKIISPENKTYDNSSIPVSVDASETAFWIANSFDGGPNITECRNCNWYSRYDLNFELGQHTVTVYASDYENRVSKASVIFTVKI